MEYIPFYSIVRGRYIYSYSFNLSKLCHTWNHHTKTLSSYILKPCHHTMSIIQCPIHHIMSLALTHQVVFLFKDEPHSSILYSLSCLVLSLKNQLMLKMSLVIWIHPTFSNGEISWRDEPTFFFCISPKHWLWFQCLVGTQEIMSLD